MPFDRKSSMLKIFFGGEDFWFNQIPKFSMIKLNLVSLL